MYLEENNSVNERLQLAINRISTIKEEHTVGHNEKLYFDTLAQFIEHMYQIRNLIQSGKYNQLSMEELLQWNEIIYKDELANNFTTSFLNINYCIACFGEKEGRFLNGLYKIIRNIISATFSKRDLYFTIFMELFIEIYNLYEENISYYRKKDCLYWFMSDYGEYFDEDYIQKICGIGDSCWIDYLQKVYHVSDLFQYGKYISKKDIECFHYYSHLSKEELHQLALQYVESYEKKYIKNTNGKKIVIPIKYYVGLEPVVDKVVTLLKEQQIETICYWENIKTSLGNSCYDNNFSNVKGLHYDKQYKERRIQSLRFFVTKYQEKNQIANVVLSIEPKEFEAISLSEKQKELEKQFEIELKELLYLL